MRKLLIFLFFVPLFSFVPSAQAQTTHVKKVVFQGFWWDYWNSNYPHGWSNYLAELAPRLADMGVDAVWIPPSYKNADPSWVGYGPMDQYDLGDKYQKGGPDTHTRMGTKDELLRMIAVMHANGIEVIQDVVLNHVDGAGSNTGAGGQDPEMTYSMASSAGYKNFRYVSFATPYIDGSQDDYWTRSGRWSKNYPNFHPNLTNNCTTGDICDAFFGPDFDFNSTAYGQSSNIPTAGMPSGYPSTRPYYNPVQNSGYNYDKAMDWMIWLKKQTGVDGYRWDAVKHFDIYVQREITREMKYNLGSHNGEYSMFNVGEWIGGKSEIDSYVTNMAQASQGFGYEEHTGTFDFSLRAYGTGGSMYDMVVNNSSNLYDISNLPGLQQDRRFTDYTSPSARVHRTVPYVNSHDSYRPVLNANGDFSKPLGDPTGWDETQELGGKGKHIDPREPRMAAAYAVNFAMDGNPIIFLEDAFDIGTTGKRYSHLPTSTTDLPNWNDVENIAKCHQKLEFKNGDYKVRSAEAGAFFPTGSTAGDHLAIERSGKAVIGINDNFGTDQEIWIDSDFAAGTILMDYSGANGLTTSLVQNDQRVFIKTIRVGHSTPGVFGHGYSVWAPVPGNTAFTSVANMFAHLDYQPARNTETTQEWEMANDLGDSHCNSLGQGGKTPDNSPNARVVGKIYIDGIEDIDYTVTLNEPNDSLTLEIWDLNGNLLDAKSDKGTSFSGTYSPPAGEKWIVFKLRNTYSNTPGQGCKVSVDYTAPKVVATNSNPATNQISIWTSNGGTQDWNDCKNWEEGIVPACTDAVLVPHPVDLMPTFDDCFTGNFNNLRGLSVSPKIFLEGAFDTATGLMQDSLRAKGYLPTTTPYGGTETVDVSIFDTLGNNAIVDWIKIELRDKSNSTTILHSRSALLQRDGDIVEIDGISPVFFNDVAFDDYFISIKHRNHLGIMSANSITFSSTIESVDFSTITTFGTDAQKNLAAGITGMWAADVDNSASIDAADRSSVWSVRNFLNYQSDDANLNGTCNADDRILTWNNRNRAAQLP